MTNTNKVIIPKCEVLFNADSIYWVGFVAYGKLSKDQTKEEWIGFSHEPDSNFQNIICLKTKPTKHKQQIILNKTGNQHISWQTMFLIHQYGTEEDVKKMIKLIRKDAFFVIQYYRLFGYDGSLDDIILNSSLFYMIEFPQIYFSRPIKSKEQIKSNVFSEKINYETLQSVCGVVKGNQPVFVNDDGNFVMKTNSVPFTIANGRQLMTINEECLKIFNERKMK